MIRPFLMLLLSVVLSAPAGAQGDAPASAPAFAAPETPAGERLAWALDYLNGEIEPDYHDNFTGRVTRRISMRQMNEALARMRAQSGGWTAVRVERSSAYEIVALLRAEGTGAGWQLELRVAESLPHRIDGLRLTPGVQPPRLESWDAIATALEDVSGDAALAVYEIDSDGAARAIFTHDASAVMSIGEAAGVYVIGAVVDRLLAGEYVWKSPVTIVENLKSLPPGPAYSAKDGSTMPLEALVRAMARGNDRSAFDHLVHAVGRPLVERRVAATSSSPHMSAPFLMTRERALLRAAPDDVLDAWADADESERRAMLDDVIPGLTLAGAPVERWTSPRRMGEVGWFASANDLCLELAALYVQSRTLAAHGVIELMEAGPMIPVDRIAWPQASAKVGSDPGVIAAALLLERSDERRFAVALIVNDASGVIDGEALQTILPSATALLGELP